MHTFLYAICHPINLNTSFFPHKLSPNVHTNSPKINSNARVCELKYASCCTRSTHILSYSSLLVEFNSMERNSSTSSTNIVKLECSVQNYDWGRVGRQSSVARLYERNSGGKIAEETPYAEFWMGTHESRPSYVAAEECGRIDNKNREAVNGGGGWKEQLLLKDLIEKNPRVLLGDRVFGKWGAHLPFLFKVLSIAKALPIQAHPDKDLALALHKAQPNVYKDANHKPEMALALTDFEALCGFISLEELKCVAHNVPEIVEAIGKEFADKLFDLQEFDGEGKAKEVLQSIFTKLMSVNADVIKVVLSRLISRLRLKAETRELTDKENLVLWLEKQYHGDVGVLAAFLFNHVKLKPGEALFLGPNEPHAYISGECIECMATSDNVVRAGLTPRTRDIQTLCSMLTYKQGLPDILQGVALNSHIIRYSPPFDEFEVDSCILPQESSTGFGCIPGPSIFVVMAGEGVMHDGFSKELVAEGDVLFTPANIEITVATVSGLALYRTGVNSQCFEEAKSL